MIPQQSDKQLNGFIALVSVTIITAIAVATAISILLVSADSYAAIKSVTNSNQAQILADSCAEYAIDAMKSNLNYSATAATISIGTQTCTLDSVPAGGNTNRTILASAKVGNSTRKISVAISQVNPNTIVTSWQDIQ